MIKWKGFKRVTHIILSRNDLIMFHLLNLSNLSWGNKSFNSLTKTLKWWWDNKTLLWSCLSMKRIKTHNWWSIIDKLLKPIIDSFHLLRFIILLTFHPNYLHILGSTPTKSQPSEHLYQKEWINTNLITFLRKDKQLKQWK